jgi:hypothetical protein
MSKVCSECAFFDPAAWDFGLGGCTGRLVEVRASDVPASWVGRRPVYGMVLKPSVQHLQSCACSEFRGR